MRKRTHEHKQAMHGLVDEIYTVLADSYGLRAVKRVSAMKRGYSLDVKGDYELILMSLDDTWIHHHMKYDPNNLFIELRGQGVFIQQSLTKGAANYYKLSRLLDELVIVIEALRTDTVK